VGRRLGGFVRAQGAKLHRRGLIGPGYSDTQVVQIPVCNVFNLGMKTESQMARGLLLWLLGVPLSVIVLIALFTNFI
jgi:hypothetical protein